MLKTEELSAGDSEDSWANELLNINQKKEESKVETGLDESNCDIENSKVNIFNPDDFYSQKKKNSNFAKDCKSELVVPFDQGLFGPTTNLILDDIISGRTSKVFQNKENKELHSRKSDVFPQFVLWDQTDIKSKPVNWL